MRNLSLSLLLTLSAGLAATLSAAEGTVSGTIASFSDSKLTVTKDDATTEDFTLSDTTKIMVGTAEGTKSDLTAGEKVTVTSSATGVESVSVEKAAAAPAEGEHKDKKDKKDKKKKK